MKQTKLYFITKYRRKTVFGAIQSVKGKICKILVETKKIILYRMGRSKSYELYVYVLCAEISE